MFPARYFSPRYCAKRFWPGGYAVTSTREIVFRAADLFVGDPNAAMVFNGEPSESDIFCGEPDATMIAMGDRG